jgi:nitroimidazol reductase NimA-like FMN-containing flavoprotein (pyridoxamine 5'-phosphate oxidase superfamily)
MNEGGESLRSERTAVRRLAKRGSYDQDVIYGILDEGLVCHVGFVAAGQPYVLPMAYVRVEDRLCLHGSVASRQLKTLASGALACVTVTLLDGLVLARSAFHHSMNYRSVVILGRGSAVEEPAEKLDVLRRLSEHIIPGRWDEVRGPTASELKQTLVVAIPIHEASAKVRTGPPADDEEDYALPVWAGVVPLKLQAGEPVADDRMRPCVQPPAHASRYRRPAEA